MAPIYSSSSLLWISTSGFLAVHHFEVLMCFHRMPWQGQTDNMIDRFDVRAHLDYIPEKAARPESPK